MAAVFEGGNYRNLTATGTITGSGVLLGFYVNSTSAGTIALADGATAISGTITPAIGFHRFPAAFGTSLVATIGGTLNVTLLYVPA